VEPNPTSCRGSTSSDSLSDSQPSSCRASGRRPVSSAPMRGLARALSHAVKGAGFTIRPGRSLTIGLQGKSHDISELAR
jgi:hypothetical protein